MSAVLLSRVSADIAELQHHINDCMFSALSSQLDCCSHNIMAIAIVVAVVVIYNLSLLLAFAYNGRHKPTRRRAMDGRERRAQQCSNKGELFLLGKAASWPRK